MEYEILRRKTKQNQKTTQKKNKTKIKKQKEKQQQKLITPKNCKKLIGPSCQTFKN